MELLTSYHDLMILSILSQADSYGYELSKRIKALTRDQFTIKEPTLYAALDRLRLAGLADSYDGSLTYGRKRQYFRITGTGTTEIEFPIEDVLAASPIGETYRVERCTV